MSHTQGKLHTGGVFNPTRTNPTVNLWSETPADCQSGEIVAFGVNPANARRLVACWNAMDGMPQDDIDELVKMPNAVMNLARYAEDTTKERDELVIELRKFYDEVLEEFSYYPDPHRIEAILARYQEGK